MTTPICTYRNAISTRVYNAMVNELNSDEDIKQETQLNLR